MKDTTQFHIRPARPEEAGLFYTPHPEEDKRLGTVGHVRMDFGRSGNEFWHTWWPRGPEKLNSPAFKAELQEVVNTLRKDVLKSRFAMERFCYERGGKIDGGYVQNYGYIVETERYRYYLRCNPSPGDYNGYLTAYDLAVQRQNMARDKPLVGRVSYANGDAQEFTDAEAFLKCLREELPYRSTTGLRYEVMTDDPNLRKAVDDIAFDLYGEENPRQLKEQFQEKYKLSLPLKTQKEFEVARRRMGALTKDEKTILSAMVLQKGEVEAGEILANSPELLSDYTVLKGINSYAALGRYYLANETTVPEELHEYMDLGALGCRYEDEHPGVFIGSDYVRYPPQEQEMEMKMK